MILYNMRYRGPYEYDKFVLNVLQIYNAISLNETKELKDNKNELNSLVSYQKTINNEYEKILKTDNDLSIISYMFY